MMSIDDSMRKWSQSGSNELRERLSVAAVRAKRAGMMQHKFQQKSTKRESVDGSIGRALATSTGTIEFSIELKPQVAALLKKIQHS